ncbi:hypothetical protein [Sorangium sp. So ce233]|uniref:hypothetical protein n=1 Tax=Sorangium sp. So ce233 TaxID=3133290 RepID=UPI003F63217C
MAGANGMSTKGGPMAPKGRAMPVGVTTAPVRAKGAGGGAGAEDQRDAAVARMRAAAAKVNGAKTDAEARAGERQMSAAIRSLRAARGAGASAATPKAAPRPARRVGTAAAAPKAAPARPAAKPVYKKGGFEVTSNGRGGFALRHAQSGMVLSDSLTKNYAKQLANHWSNPKSGGATFQKALKGDKKAMDWVAQWTAEGARRSASKIKTVH